MTNSWALTKNLTWKLLSSGIYKWLYDETLLWNCTPQSSEHHNNGSIHVQLHTNNLRNNLVLEKSKQQPLEHFRVSHPDSLPTIICPVTFISATHCITVMAQLHGPAGWASHIFNTNTVTPKFLSGHPVAYPGILFGGVQQIQLRTEDRENGDLGAVAP